MSSDGDVDLGVVVFGTLAVGETAEQLAKLVTNVTHEGNLSVAASTVSRLAAFTVALGGAEILKRRSAKRHEAKLAADHPALR